MRRYLLGCLAALVLLVGVLPLVSATGIQQVDEVQDQYGARGLHWQPGQFMLVFWLPEDQDFVTYIGNVTSNVTAAKRAVWTQTCAQEMGQSCTLTDLVWLDNPRTYEWQNP